MGRGLQLPLERGRRARPVPDRNACSEAGFTLVELLVVLAIIGILASIALFAFASLGDRASERAVQAELRTAMFAARGLAIDHEGLFLQADGTPIDAVALGAVEPGLDFSDGVETGGDGVIGLTVGPNADGVNAARAFLATRATTGTYFAIMATSDGRVTFCRFDEAVAADDDCLNAQW